MSQKFITTEPLGKSGEKAEKLVWEKIQQAFRDRECIAYWRYPIFSPQGKFRKEPDILIADRLLGLIIIEVKSLFMEQIVSITGHRWQYQNFYTNWGNPYQQAENQLFALLEYSNLQPNLKGKVTAKAIISLPNIQQAQWQEQGFHELPSSPPILFSNQLYAPELIINFIQQTPPVIQGEPLNNQQWRSLLGLLGGTPLFSPPTHRVLAPNTSRGKILQQLRQRIAELDLQQERIGKEIPPGPQRIRGIAGSGKTILLCQKAAHMHLKHPDWKIAVVFFSRTLYYPIQQQIQKWLRHFSNNSSTTLSTSPSNSNLQILHAWGSRTQPGFYTILCQLARTYPLSVGDSSTKQPNEALAEVCIQLLRSSSIPQIYDAILIDEGQDLMADKWKYEGKQPFYWLAYQALRPVDPIHPEQRRLIWAYDEAQSLDSLAIPTASELFGPELGHLVTGKHRGGINKSEIMKRCYRTPHLILTAAHGISMGLLRPQGMLTGITRKEEWEAIGYEVKGSFYPGGEITLKRPRANSPNPIEEFWPGSVIDFKVYTSRLEELKALAKNIVQNLRADGLRPSQEILVLVVGPFFEAMRLEIEVAGFLRRHHIDIFLPGTKDCNILKPDRKEKIDRNKFWCQGGVTVSRLHKAKGQEADLVYVVGLDSIASDESNVYLRNQLFVALTRARGWVKISGIGSYPMYEELEKVIASKDSFSFTFRRQPRREMWVTDAGELLQRFALGGRNFQQADLQEAQLWGVHLKNANFIGANLRGANLQQAQLDGIKLVAADLRGVDLTGASLRKAKLMGANLQGASLRGADLRGADLSDADLEDVDWQDADLRGAIAIFQ